MLISNFELLEWTSEDRMDMTKYASHRNVLNLCFFLIFAWKHLDLILNNISNVDNVHSIFPGPFQQLKIENKHVQHIVLDMNRSELNSIVWIQFETCAILYMQFFNALQIIYHTPD